MSVGDAGPFGQWPGMAQSAFVTFCKIGKFFEVFWRRDWDQWRIRPATMKVQQDEQVL